MFVRPHFTPKDVNQSQLEKILIKLFPNENIKTNVRQESLIVNPETRSLFELDIWIPSINICFEFQDEYHYINKWYSQDSVDSIQQRDLIKKEVVLRKGISSVLVPYWWDGSKESIMDTILFERPDLVDLMSFKPSKQKSFPVPINPPPALPGVPDVGELMLAIFPLPAYVSSLSPEDPFWMGEKYDGIRACWNPNKGILYSRRGLSIEMPLSFSSLFPHIFLDTEVWLGRGQFGDTMSLYKSSFAAIEGVPRIVAFDVPTAKHEKRMLPFEKRYARLLSSISPTHSFIAIAPRMMCDTSKMMKKLMEYVIKDGGEGVILRQPNSPYIHGRSQILWKIKAGQQDAEALVLKVNKDMATLQLPDGMHFDVGLKGEELKKNDVVTFTYDTWQAQSTPVNPVIVRIRQDMSWEEVMLNHSLDNSGKENSKTLNKTKINSKEDDPSKTVARNYYFEVKNRRAFFDEFAKQNGFDPLVPDHWYNVRTISLMSIKGSSILNYYSASVVRALMHIYPDIGLKEDQFLSRTMRYWFSQENRRKFCDNFARTQGFDPLIPDHWYSVSRPAFFAQGPGLINYFGGNYVRTIVNTFPDVKFDASKFSDQTFKRRQWFLDFAKRHSFDPLKPENWHKRKLELLSEKKAMKNILYFHKGSIKYALLSLFPDIGLQPSKLRH